jgi:hypothetical protein
VAVAEHGASAASLEDNAQDDGSSGIKREVALKLIPKKKVKGNEDSVWGEMEVLKGLDHINIVRALVSKDRIRQLLTQRVRSNFMNGSSREQNTTSLSSLLWAESCLSG